MKKQNAIQLFEDKKVRTLWDEEREKWYISIIDVIEILTNTDRPRKYWSDLKAKLKKEGSELSEKIGQLKMLARYSFYVLLCVLVVLCVHKEPKASARSALAKNLSSFTENTGLRILV